MRVIGLCEEFVVAVAFAIGTEQCQQHQILCSPIFDSRVVAVATPPDRRSEILLILQGFSLFSFLFSP